MHRDELSQSAWERIEDLLPGRIGDAGVTAADKGYDADWLVDLVKSTHHAEPVIPPRKGRKQPRDYDRHTYKQRNLVERFIGWAKHFRRAATRYDKTARNFLALWDFVAIVKLLK